MSSRGITIAGGFVTLACAIAAAATPSFGASGRVQRATAAAGCASPQIAAPRAPSNPLALAQSPGADPLHGAHFFVDGPSHGVVAREIETLLHIDNNAYGNTNTWAAFRQQVQSALSDASATTSDEVTELLKIGASEEPQNVSLYNQGGGAGAVYAQVSKILCDNLASDPTPDTVPVFTTFFARPRGKACSTPAALRSWWPTFKRMVREMASAIGRSRALVLDETGSLTQVACLGHGTALSLWLTELRYEADAFAALPHTVAYLDAGSADEGSASMAAKLLVQADIARVEGFYTNDNHLNWSSAEIKRDNRISADVHRLLRRRHVTYTPHYVVNTADNGRGPKLITRRLENVCNPPGRGLGRLPTANTAPTADGRHFPLLDAFLWTAVPGRSYGSECYRGAAPGGQFDLRYGLELATNANQQLGPGFPSLPY